MTPWTISLFNNNSVSEKKIIKNVESPENADDILFPIIGKKIVEQGHGVSDHNQKVYHLIIDLFLKIEIRRKKKNKPQVRKLIGSTEG